MPENHKSSRAFSKFQNEYLLGNSAANFCVFFLEAVNATFDIKNFLFAGEERVANIANVDRDFFAHAAASFKFISASADYKSFCIFWVNVLFHSSSDLPLSAHVGNKFFVGFCS